MSRHAVRSRPRAKTPARARPGRIAPGSSARIASRPRPALRRAEHVRLALADHAHVERLARMFKALGDPTRSKLVFALSLGELCVSELADALGASLSATSHQLRILRDLEIVRVRRAGKSQLYVLNEQAFGFCSPRSCQAWKSAFAPDPGHTV
jgi:DNA-binding transcriptional ArsR family regulator